MRVALTDIVTFHSFSHHQMVKVKAVKPPKVAKAKAGKVGIPPPPPIQCSPVTRSNSASTKESPTILSPSEQKSFKQWISEIKQIQGLIICKCGLYIQGKSATPQIMQQSLFVKEFGPFYEIMGKDSILGSRVMKIPFIYLTVGTSKATETLNGEKLRKKYSSMKTYINNVLSPIYKRYQRILSNLSSVELHLLNVVSFVG